MLQSLPITSNSLSTALNPKRRVPTQRLRFPLLVEMANQDPIAFYQMKILNKQAEIKIEHDTFTMKKQNLERMIEVSHQRYVKILEAKQKALVKYQEALQKAKAKVAEAQPPQTVATE